MPGEPAEAAWLDARDAALAHAEQLRATGVHKQIVNRVLEPWMWASVIVSSTTYDNFFTLRCHPDAQPEIKRLADLMRAAFDASTPVPRAAGEWHLPFVGADDERLVDRGAQAGVGGAVRARELSHARRHPRHRRRQASCTSGCSTPATGRPSSMSPWRRRARRGSTTSRGWQAYRHQMEQARVLVMSEVAPA